MQPTNHIGTIQNVSYYVTKYYESEQVQYRGFVRVVAPLDEMRNDTLTFDKPFEELTQNWKDAIKNDIANS